MDSIKKFRVVFPFVEAGLGHIMPMTAIADIMQEKYGDRVEVIRTDFFKDTDNPNLRSIEQEFEKEVKLHNKNKLRGTLQFLLMSICGTRLTMKYLMEQRYKKGFAAAINYIKSLNADIIFNTHFSTLYYACEARNRGVFNAQIMAYCPDPIIGRQWDSRVDLIGLSSELGKQKVIKSNRFDNNQVNVVPFFIRREVNNFNLSKAEYRAQLCLPEQFTVLLADGAYGAGKLKKTVYELLKSKKKMTVIAVCGKNDKLFKEFSSICAPENITFRAYGFTDKMLTLSAACDLFVGKAGASNLAEPAYFGAPAIITFRATPVEKWISEHYVKHVGSAIRQENIKKAIKLIEHFTDSPLSMEPYQKACLSQHRSDGAELFADKIWETLQQSTSSIVTSTFIQPQTVPNQVKI